MPEVIVVDAGYELGKCAPCSPVEEAAGERGVRKIRLSGPLENRRLLTTSGIDDHQKGKKPAGKARKGTKENKRKHKPRNGHDECQMSSKGPVATSALSGSLSDSSLVKLLPTKTRKV
jgi:hypothetical protein